MTEYRFHWWADGSAAKLTPPLTIEAESRLHGAALALQRFRQQGCDIKTPLAHVDAVESTGFRHTLLVDEVLEWLHDPKQAAFVRDEHLADLLH